MPSRLLSPVAAAGMAMATLVVPAAALDADSDPSRVGSFGEPDDFSAVVNQSVALMAFANAGETPPADSVTWLLNQQCTDGAFVPYRADLSAECPEPDPATFTGKDTNTTAYAAMALSAVGEDEATAAAMEWLAGQTEADGGWAYYPGGDTDPNSTGLVLSAYAATGTDAADEALDALMAFSLRCDAEDANRGGFFTAFDPSDTVNSLATVQAVPGALGIGYPVPAGADGGPWGQPDTVPALECPGEETTDDVALAGAGWLARQIAENGGFVPQNPAFGEGPDFATTADAVAVLAGVGCCRTQTEQATTWLADNYEDHVSTDGVDRPGALAKLALSLQAADLQQELADGLLLRIEATRIASEAATSGPVETEDPEQTDQPATPTPSPEAEPDEEEGSNVNLLLVLGVLLVGVAVAVALSRRNQASPSGDGPSDASGPSSG